MDKLRKKKKIIGCEEINSLPIDDIVQSFGHLPVRRANSYCVYRSPLREDKNPSFITYRNTNKYKDMATGELGSVIDFVVAHEQCSVSDAIKIVKNRGFVIPLRENLFLGNKNDNRVITSIREIRKYALLKYANDRGISKVIVQQYLKEVNYQTNGKNYFSLGLENVLGGWELRNKYMKSSVNGKSFSFFEGKNRTVWITEGMFDFLSLMQKEDEFGASKKDHFIILNSTTNYVKCKKYLKHFSEINLCLDNDGSGKKLALRIQKDYGDKVNNWSSHYQNFNDLNDYLMAHRK